MNRKIVKGRGVVWVDSYVAIEADGNPGGGASRCSWGELLAARELWERVELPRDWRATTHSTFSTDKGSSVYVGEDPAQLRALADYLDAVRAMGGK